MSGQWGNTAYLVTETELTTLAAVSGLDSLLSFRPIHPFGKAEQLEAVYQLLHRGALVQNGALVGISDELTPIFSCIAASVSAVLLTPRNCTAPQLCLYCTEKEVVYIMPHETKHGNLRLGLLAMDELPDFLEELGLLPVPFMAESATLVPLREEDVRPLTISSSADRHIQGRVPLDEAILTVLERFNHMEGTVQARAAIFRTPLSWGFGVFSDRTVYEAYERKNVLRWIRGSRCD